MKDGKKVTLAIESSCDETAAAVMLDGREVLSSIISSQIDIHKLYGGVVPEIASRHHLENVNMVVDQALQEAGITFDDVDMIGVTYGPGLVGALLIGLATAKAYALASGKPLIGVHHIHGHICANYIEHRDLEPPFMALVISGGHTNIVEVTGYNECRVLGGTRDDAAGEAYDKVARVLGLGYPGGPLIDKLAKEGDPHAVEFKRVFLEKGSLDFSFSGIKTALLYHVRNHAGADGKLPPELLKDTVASYQEAVIDVLARKTMLAAKNFHVKTIVAAGGVACNSLLRERLTQLTPPGVRLRLAERKYCTDNAAMVGGLGWHYFRRGEFTSLDADSYARLPAITQVPFLGE